MEGGSSLSAYLCNAAFSALLGTVFPFGFGPPAALAAAASAAGVPAFGGKPNLCIDLNPHCFGLRPSAYTCNK